MLPALVSEPFAKHTLRALPPLRATACRLLLVRHGESSSNASGRLCGGGTDTPLNDTGRRQARAVGETLAQLQVQLNLVASSTLQRVRAAVRERWRRIACVGCWRLA